MDVAHVAVVGYLTAHGQGWRAEYRQETPGDPSWSFEELPPDDWYGANHYTISNLTPERYTPAEELAVVYADWRKALTLLERNGSGDWQRAATMLAARYGQQNVRLSAEWTTPDEISF